MARSLGNQKYLTPNDRFRRRVISAIAEDSAALVLPPCVGVHADDPALRRRRGRRLS